ncbi:MAG TPA: hypothetical protein VLB44_12870 [Kofleriaceae bacterium]|nr:hypothetical protein [Kofleriaceae bacterium]
MGELIDEAREFADEAFLARDTPERPHALIAVGSTNHAETAHIARTLAAQLEFIGYIVEIAEAKAHGMPGPPDYDLVIVGLSPHLHDHDLLRWIEGIGTTLCDVTSALFLLGRGDDRSYVMTRLAELGWRPHAVTTFPSSEEPGDIERSITAFVEDLATLVSARASS